MGSGPGTRARAMAPASSPTINQAMIPMPAPFASACVYPGVTRRKPGSKGFRVKLGLGPEAERLRTPPSGKTPA